MSRISSFTDWYSSLQQRERMMIILTTIVIIITLFFLLVWEPIHKGLEQEQQRLQSQQDILVWMQQAQQEVRALKATGVRTNKRNSNTPISLSIEQTAATSGIKSFLTKMESSGKDTARASLDGVSFNQMMLWINTLEHSYGVLASSVNIEGTDKSGLVNARITFSRGG